MEFLRNFYRDNLHNLYKTKDSAFLLEIYEKFVKISHFSKIPRDLKNINPFYMNQKKSHFKLYERSFLESVIPVTNGIHAKLVQHKCLQTFN